MAWLSDNLGTIVVCAILVAIVAAVIVSVVSDKRRGKSSCGANCGHCPMSGSCHKQK